MQKNVVRILIGLIAVALIATPLFAAGIHFDAKFMLGSLIAEGSVAGIGATDGNLILDASGLAQVVCQNQGGNQAPGRNPARVSAEDTQFLPGNDPLRKNGKAPFSAEASVDTSVPLPGPSTQYGCANGNWTAYPGSFVLWDSAILTFTDGSTGATLGSQKYSCVTTPATKKTPASVSCTPVP